MTAQAQAPEDTTAASSSPKSSPPAEPSPKAAAGVRPGISLGVRQPTHSTTTGNGAGFATGSETAADQGPSDPLDTENITPSASSEAAEAVPLKLSSDELRDVFRGLVMAAALGLHRLLARNAIEEELGLWAITDEKEAGKIGDPLSSIAKRHAGGLAFDADTGDLIKAGSAAAGYVAKNAVRAVQIRLALRRARRAGQTEPSQEESQ